jgi:hypothetical protein
MSNGAAQLASAIARYRVVRELGKRSQRTYAAVRNDGSLVVLHRFTRGALTTGFDGELVSAEEMALLLRDARSLAKNWHPNVARVRHAELAGDVLDVATDLLDGVTLEELIGFAAARRAHPEEPVLSHAILARIFLDVLAGLSALHSLRDGINTPLGLFHGALCPTNVIIGKDGVARIVSVFRPRPVTIGATSEALGWASPEALAGERAQDARVDVYAVGVMLWEALMERRLYDETSPARIAQRQREEDIKAPNARLAEAAMRALAFDPALRFRTAQEMAANIRALAGTVAQGSRVAQVVSDLAGDRIRIRRAELDGEASVTRHSTPPMLSGTRMRASAPPVADRPSRTFALSGSPGSLATVAAREIRVPPPTAPDVETSYAPRPLPARRGRKPPPLPSAPSAGSPPSVAPRAPPLTEKAAAASLTPPDDADDDDLPGPRQSTSENDYLDQLSIAALPGPRPSIDDFDVDSRADHDSNADLGPVRKPPAITPIAQAPFFPAVSRPPVLPKREPSTRTPFVVDVLPTMTPPAVALAPRVRLSPPVIALLAGAVLLLIVGGTLVARSQAPSAARGDAPPPAVDPLPKPAVSSKTPTAKKRSTLDPSN